MLLRVIFLGSVLLTGCASDETIDVYSDMTADYPSIQENLFSVTCASSNCHGGGNANQTLNLLPENAYDQLVNKASAGNTSTLLVNPGDPDNSYLIQALEGTVTEIPRMPRDRSALPQSAIDKVRLWIENGALSTAE